MSSTNQIGIQIRLVKDTHNSLKDEMITVTKTNSGIYRIQFKSYFSQTRTTMYFKHRDGVVGYLRAVFGMIKIDSENFDSLQADVSGFPVAIVPLQNVREGYDTEEKIMRAVMMMLNNWPAKCVYIST